jgi:hypothetical protein
VVEAGQPQLDGAGVVEPGIGVQVCGQPLRQRGSLRTPLGPSKNAGVPVITRYSPGNRPESTSSTSWRSALSAFSRTSPRTRCSVSTSSSTNLGYSAVNS